MRPAPSSSYPIPGLLRLRALQPLSDRDGSCGLIYDLERAAVLEVPVELQLHIAAALETGDLDEDLVSWLIGEDLLTAEGWEGWSADGSPYRRQRAGRSELASLLRSEDEHHGFIAETDERAVAEGLDLIFKSGFGASRIRLHLDWGGRVPAVALVEWILIESCRRAAISGQAISYELALDADEVAPALVHRLAGYPVHVRLGCRTAAEETGVAIPPWTRAEEAVFLAHGALGDELTVQCDLAPPHRLADLWEWAKALGVRHLDVRLGEEPARRGAGFLAPLRGLRADLLAICQEMSAELSARRTPIDFEPLTRIVRRLARHEACGGLLGLSGVDRASSWLLGNAADADAWVGRLLSPTELEGEGSGSACQGCWARYACTHSTFVPPSVGVEERREPSEERCSAWRAEVEAALRLYHGLQHVEPLALLRLFEEPESVAPVDRDRAMPPAVWSSKPS